MFTRKEKDSFRFLVLSDIHQSFDNLQKMKHLFSTLSPETTKFDFVLSPGDFLNLSVYSKSPDEPAYAIGEGELSSIISFLEFFATPTIYTPGNHDPYTLFEPKNPEVFNELPMLTPQSTNIHGRTIELASDLFITGWGGSTPAHLKKNGSPIYEGFPFKSEEEMAADFKKKLPEKLTPGVFHILMTHMGPDASGTSENHEGELITMGSKTITEYILKNKETLVCNVHGHSHSGFGLKSLQGVQVVNPGALKEGRVATMKVTRNPVTRNWALTETSFINLTQ